MSWLLAAAIAVGPPATAEPTAPLTVTFRAEAGAQSYMWDFGDGTTGHGQVVEHLYAAPGRYAAKLTTEAGESPLEALAYRVSFGAPERARFGQRGRFSGSIWPAVAAATVEISGPGGVIARTRTRANGSFVVRARVRSPGPFRARVAGLLSEDSRTRLHPRLEVRVAGGGLVGDPPRIVAQLRPRRAGTLEVVVWRNGRRTYSGAYDPSVRLRADSPAAFRVRVSVRPAEGFAAVERTLRTAVIRPGLSLGSHGAGVRAVERRLVELRYALPAVDSVFALTTYQALLAFQKVEGLPRTGRADARTWRRLQTARAPRARYPGTHLEVSKSRQVLYVVERGTVRAVVHVSTGATGNTPLGHWRIYRKVTGWDWVLWYPMYFLRGFAIHGYPEVPAHPASHGCVRVPMWIAPQLFTRHTLGQSVYVY